MLMLYRLICAVVLAVLRGRLRARRDKLKLAQASLGLACSTATDQKTDQKQYFITLPPTTQAREVKAMIQTQHSRSTTTLTTALKEWSVAVDALAQGETIVLLRKGGIRERQGKFEAEASQVVLFPTFEHQKPELLKPQYHQAISPVPPGWHPETITLKAWANITHIFLTDNTHKVEALSDFHIWQPNLAQERLKWKPKQPLYVLALRAYRLPKPIRLPWDASYGGCRSWVDLKAGVEVNEAAKAAIAEADYQAQIEALATLLSQ
jgi:hypothetical protein